MEEFEKQLLIVLQSLAESNNRIAEFLGSIHLTEKGRIGTNDYATFMNSKIFAVLLKSILIELQKLNAERQKVAEELTK